ncbi:class I SAM-dependent methyltransferase [Actinokineospora enzanensis]|uniref:class I SAM-dependent methyltransferase n=1 Tax=Actinokineospora enzanensis TaxID=155975 RepID=UPI0012EC16F5|nr:class I SAM-dependent methyltransferase [Actinokineospora enzanensis]
MGETMFHTPARNQDDLVRFYLDKNTDSASLFHVWEDGGSRGDSVTPSTYSLEYRTWMADRLAAELDRDGGELLSLGCGNAAVEAELVDRGYRVLAIDAMPEAVELARRKGVQAECADIYQWEPGRHWTVAYIDGVLGHLNDPAAGLVPVLSRIRAWLKPGADGLACLVASNDAPNDGSPVQQAPGVDGFHWLSADYIADQAVAAGFDKAEPGEFRYHRPISGERVRSIVTAHLTR